MSEIVIIFHFKFNQLIIKMYFLTILIFIKLKILIWIINKSLKLYYLFVLETITYQMIRETVGCSIC